MGRNISWRKTIFWSYRGVITKKLFLTVLITFIFISNVAGKIPEGFIQPAQDIGGQRVYSIEIPEDPMIYYYINEYLTTNGKKTMAAILNRGAPYLGFIYNKLVEKNMPPELMYLPAIESAFHVSAVSRSGATGFWQFMMNSIYPYDIEVDEWRDDRRDFWKATEAAIHKLNYNYERTGSWPLAIAAYNCGLGRIERAVKASGVTDYIKLYDLGYIPKQTRNYVPKFFAFAHLAFYSSNLNLEIAPLFSTDTAKMSDNWEQIPVDKVINITILSTKTGIPLKTLSDANAELRHGITPPDDSFYNLKVPVKYSDKLKYALQETNEPLMHFYIHEIQGGDTFYALSRHFGVSVSMIQMYNPGVNPHSLRNGQKIIIPALRKVEAFKRDKVQPKSWEDSTTYTIKKGDTLWSISQKFNTTVENICYNNGFTSEKTLGIGMTINVPRR